MDWFNDDFLSISSDALSHPMDSPSTLQGQQLVDLVESIERPLRSKQSGKDYEVHRRYELKQSLNKLKELTGCEKRDKRSILESVNEKIASNAVKLRSLTVQVYGSNAADHFTREMTLQRTCNSKVKDAKGSVSHLECFDSSTLPKAALRPDGGILRMNEQFVKLLGESAPKVSQSILVVTSDEYLSFVMEVFQKVLENSSKFVQFDWKVKDTEETYRCMIFAVYQLDIPKYLILSIHSRMDHK